MRPKKVAKIVKTTVIFVSLAKRYKSEFAKLWSIIINKIAAPWL